MDKKITMISITVEHNANSDFAINPKYLKKIVLNWIPSSARTDATITVKKYSTRDATL